MRENDFYFSCGTRCDRDHTAVYVAEAITGRKLKKLKVCVFSVLPFLRGFSAHVQEAAIEFLADSPIPTISFTCLFRVSTDGLVQPVLVTMHTADD